MVGRLPCFKSSNLMLSVLRGTDDTLEIEDVLNSKHIFVLLKDIQNFKVQVFNRNNILMKSVVYKCVFLIWLLDQREFGENNIDPHALFNAKF